MSKNRVQKLYEYDEKYSQIPKDFNDRLLWLCNQLNINSSKQEEIFNKRDAMMQSLYYYDFNIFLYEEPEGAKRPRFRLINRQNITNFAMNNPDFIHIYSPEARSDSIYMKRLLTEDDLLPYNQLIHTPCSVEISTFHKIPSGTNAVDTILSEIGIIRPPFYPDWDNIGKKYSDMFNSNIWMDDDLVIDGTVHKFYSVLPRIEVNIKYLNMIYNKQMYNKISSRVGYDESMNLQYFKMEDYQNGLYK